MRDKMNRELMNELYDSALLTSGLVPISWVFNKFLKVKVIESRTNVESAVKLGGGIAVKYAQDKKRLPTGPFKSN